MTKKEIVKKLHNLLKPVQKEMFQSFYKKDSRKFVAHCSRRLGKTFFLCVISSITCTLKSNAQVRYASVTQKAVKKMIHPTMRAIWVNFPVTTRPKWNTQDGAYIFPNGSMIHVAGVNNQHADDLRGTAADLAVVDESGFVDDLTYLVDSVLLPQLMPQPNFPDGGRLIMASSSPLSPAHDFTEYINEAKLKGFYVSFDIHQAGYTKKTVEEFCEEAGGAGSTSWRREYLNEILTDDKLSVTPEWQDYFVQRITRPDYFNCLHKYVAMDIGVRDKTALLFGFYDFPKARLIVESEWSTSGQDTTTQNIAENTKSIESELGYSSVYRRVADNNNLILLNDLGSSHSLSFTPTGKDTLAAMVNELRIFIGSGRLIVNPDCTELIQCLKFGVYQDDKRQSFGRSKALGHFDMLAALIYLVRNLDQSTNPIPKNYTSTFDTFNPDQEPRLEDSIKRIFNL